MSRIRTTPDGKFVRLSIPDARTEAQLDRDPRYTRLPGQLKWLINPLRKKKTKKKYEEPKLEVVEEEIEERIEPEPEVPEAL